MIFMNLVEIDKFEIQKCERAALASRAAQRGVGLALSASPLPLLLRLLVHSAAGLISRSPDKQTNVTVMSSAASCDEM